MQPDNQSVTNPKWMSIAGWVLTILPTLLLFMSASMKILKPGYAPEGAPDLGWEPGLMFNIAIVEIACTLLYLFPRTAVLGAILLTGYLGGATATHVRIHDNFVMPVVIGIVVWLALYLRDSRVRALAPIRG